MVKKIKKYVSAIDRQLAQWRQEVEESVSQQAERAQYDKIGHLRDKKSSK